MSILAAATFDANIEEKVIAGNKVAYLDIGRLVANLYVTLVIVAGIGTFIYLALGGFQYITSGGDKAAVEAARNKITYALMGLAIVVGAYAFSWIIMKVFGVSLLGAVLWPGPP